MSNQIEQKLINSVSIRRESLVSAETVFTCLAFSAGSKGTRGCAGIDVCQVQSPQLTSTEKKPVPHFGNHFSSVLRKLSVNGLLPGARCSENWDSFQPGDWLTQRCPWNWCPNHLRQFWIRSSAPAGLWLQLSLQMMPRHGTICSWELIPLKSIIPDPWSCCFADGWLASDSQLSEIVPFSPFSDTSFFPYYYTSW